MKIAVPVWDGNISPVLDTAKCIKVFDVENGKIISHTEVHIDDRGIREKVQIITDTAQILLCGALSSQMASCLSSAGVGVYPWMMGNAERLVELIASGRIPGPEFSMPGCRGKNCRHHAWRNRQGRLRRGQFGKTY